MSIKSRKSPDARTTGRNAAQIAAWVPADTWPQFSPEEFVRAGLPSAAGQSAPTTPGTLYLLSEEGMAGPVVTTLTVAVVEAAEELAAQSAGGRRATPLAGVLDEAANVCRWRELALPGADRAAVRQARTRRAF